jgi:hypothetical protein
MWVKRKEYKMLVGKPEGKGTLGRPGCRWENNIKMVLREIGWGIWTQFIWYRTETSSDFLCMR